MPKNPSVDAFAYLRQQLAAYRASALQPGARSLIDLSVGNPDVGADARWLHLLAEAVTRPELQGYGEFRPEIGAALRAAFCRYYQRRFLSAPGMPQLDAERHVVDLQGSKEGIFHLLGSLLRPGDTLLLPDPCYAVYRSCAQRLGATVEYIHCDADGQPDCDAITPAQLARAKLMVACSPDNPTGTVLGEQTLARLLDFTARAGLPLLLDRAYAEIGPAQQRGPGALGLPGALDHVVELHSLSKSCGVAGWRLGFAVGAPGLLRELRAAKQECDFGGYLPLQWVAARMLDELETLAAGNSAVYQARTAAFAQTLGADWPLPSPPGGLFIWAPVPAHWDGGDDLSFVGQLLQQTGVLVAPGSGFGPAGRGHVRIAMVQPLPVIIEAAASIASWLRTLPGPGAARAGAGPAATHSTPPMAG